MNKIDFSVIIVSYKNLQIIIDCLDSIYKFNDIGGKLEVILVDNSPENNIYSYVRTNYTEVKLIKNKNMGFGEGNNKGVKASKGKYLLLLNPDTVLIEPIFQFAIEKFESNSDLGLFGVRLVDENMQRNMSFYLIDKHGFFAAQMQKICDKFDIFIDGKMYIAGADIFVRKEVFISSGMFDEAIFMYYEEPDLVKRIRINNIKTAYFKSKRIIHIEGQTSESNLTSLRRRLDSARYYSNKYQLSFMKQLSNELKYEYLKKIIYQFMKSPKADHCTRKIEILREYMILE